MYFKIRKYNSIAWQSVESLSPYDAIKKLFNEHTLFFKIRDGFSIYINPETQEKYLVEKVKKRKKK
jgi:hypothetical protein